MVNRVQHLLGEIPEATSYTDFYELEALGDTFIVALSTALAIERQIDRRGTPDWLEFHDIFGARHRLPARCVYRIGESTRATRANLRAFRKALREDERADEDPFAELG
jgi:hypothetical protein